MPGWYPDPIAASTSLTFRGTRSIWLTWHIPAEAKHGVYTGKVLVHSSIDIQEIPVILHVWNFTLPSIPSLYVSNWLHSSQLESHYKLTRANDAYWILLDNIARDMMAHRQSVIFTPLNLIQTTKSLDGLYSFDFTNYRRWIDIFLANGFQAFEGSHLLHARNSHNLTEIGRLLTKKRIEVGESLLTSPEGNKYLKQFLSAIHEENIKLGIHRKYIQHILDEPKPTQTILYRTIVNVVREAMPGVAIADAIDSKAFDYRNAIDIPITRMDHSAAPLIDDRWGRWWYTAVAPRGRYPNRFIDYPLLKMRVIPWLSWRYGISGYVHYAYNWWFTPSGKTPWKDASQAGKYPPGDGFVVYPPIEGKGTTVIPSLRWDSFRDGMEDYEYLATLDKFRTILKEKKERRMTGKLDSSAQLKKIDSVLWEIKSKFGAPERYPRRANEIEALRIKIGTLLDELSSNNNH